MLHLDFTPIISYDRTPSGMLRVKGAIARVGWLKYYNKDGSERWEFVPPQTLFDGDHLDSIGLAPLTLNHPSEKVTPENYKKYAVGTVGDRVIANHDKGIIEVIHLIGDKEAIEAVESGKAKQLSMGYDCQTKQREDGRYDQIKRIANHVSIVELARGGEELSLQIDGLHYDCCQGFQEDLGLKNQWRILSAMA